MSRWIPDIALLGGIALTVLGVLAVRAFRRANRVIREAPIRSNVVPLQRRNGVKVIPAQRVSAK